jgi:putative peptide zinc metalloprotease protein
MTRLLRSLSAALVLVAACLLPAGGAQAEPIRHEDNVATATIEQDNGRAFDLAFEVLTQRGGDVDELNAAYAGARCTDCRATAIAFQIVLVSGTPRAVTPQNRAVAINDSCTRCVVAAEARQFVRVVDQRVMFTDTARAILADVRRLLRSLEGQDLALADLHAAVEQQEERVRQVMTDEIVPKDTGEDDVDVLAKRLLEATDVN